MPFPFFPGGALLAIAVLGGAMAVFGLALKALDWTIDGVKGSMLSGMVSGLRDWERRSQAPDASTGPAGSGGEPTPHAPTLDATDAAGADLVALERVHPNEAPRYRG
jgi:hypothetical protein